MGISCAALTNEDRAHVAPQVVRAQPAACRSKHKPLEEGSYRLGYKLRTGAPALAHVFPK